ncbi:hypothetical protein VPH35_077454 [Triticum aestivum]
MGGFGGNFGWCCGVLCGSMPHLCGGTGGFEFDQSPTYPMGGFGGNCRLGAMLFFFRPNHAHGPQQDGAASALQVLDDLHVPELHPYPRSQQCLLPQVRAVPIP